MECESGRVDLACNIFPPFMIVFWIMYRFFICVGIVLRCWLFIVVYYKYYRHFKRYE